MGLIEQIEAENMKESVPAFNVGDTVKVGYRIIEGGKERIQNFEGVVIAKKNGGIRETFTVRRLSFGVGVERCFPLHSPKVAYVNVVRAGQDQGKEVIFRKTKKSPIRLKSEVDRLFCLRARAPQGLSAKNLLFFRKIALKTVYNRRVIG